MTKLFFLLFAAASCLFGSDQEIVVELGVSSPLSSVYLCHWSLRQTQLDHKQIQELQQILQRNLELSGRVQLLKNTDEKESLFKGENYKEAFAHPVWENEKVDSILKIVLKGRTLSAFIYSTSGKFLKQIPDITLNEDVIECRMTMHKLSDAIHRILFGSNGIATTRILYSLQTPGLSSSSKDWKSEIWVCNYDGTENKQMTKEGSYSINPIFFPAVSGYQANKSLYVCYKNGLPKIHLLTFGDVVGKPIIPLRGNQLLPAISRNRDILAFISDAGGRADLFVQHFSPATGLIGKPIQAFTFPQSVQASPTFSPDGSHLAFVSDKEGTPRIYVIETPHKGLKKLPDSVCLTKTNRENTCPSWSPDGKKLAYSARTEGTRQIWIYDFEQQIEHQLTHGPQHKENPSWAPNSLHLVYNTCDPDSSELFIINLNEKKPRKITSGPGKKHYPAWEP